MQFTDWMGKTNDGKAFHGCQTDWNDVKDDITELEFMIEHSDGVNATYISLPKDMEYVQAKTASAPLAGGSATIESRYIGFKLGNNIVKVRVDEKTSNVSIEIE